MLSIILAVLQAPWTQRGRMPLGLLCALSRTYPQVFRDWSLQRASSARSCTKCLRYGRRKRPTQTYTHDAGGEGGALWVLLLRLCAPSSLIYVCLSLCTPTGPLQHPSEAKAI